MIVEAEYAGSAFECGQATYYLYPTISTLESLGQPQDPVIFFGDNEITIGVSNDEVKVKRSKKLSKNLITGSRIDVK